MESSKIKKKIHGLYKLSQSSGYEAEAAKEKMIVLLEKYQLELETVLIEGCATDVIQEELFKKKRLAVYDKFILDLLQTFYHVAILISSIDNAYILAGTRESVIIARNMYYYMENSWKELYTRYVRQRKKVQSQAYYLGLYVGIYRRLQEQQNSCQTSLVRYNRESIVKEMEKIHGEMGEKEHPRIILTDKPAYWKGEIDGYRIGFDSLNKNGFDSLNKNGFDSLNKKWKMKAIEKR